MVPKKSCAKCGITSEEDSSLTFHKFPLPSVHGPLKAKVWAKYCFPNDDWTSEQSLFKLHRQHKFLCAKHFDYSSFTRSDRSRLSKYAIPSDAKNILAQTRDEMGIPIQDTQVVSKEQSGTSQCSSTTPEPSEYDPPSPVYILVVLEEQSSTSQCSSTSNELTNENNPPSPVFIEMDSEDQVSNYQCSNSRSIEHLNSNKPQKRKPTKKKTTGTIVEKVAKKNLKCAKCGATSEEDSSLTFHKFPPPSVHGPYKAKVWATYCFPNEDWTSEQSLFKLHRKNKFLCGKHFDDTSFTSRDRIRLNKYAIPTEAQNISRQIRDEMT